MTQLRRVRFLLPVLPLALLQGCGPAGHVASAATEAPPPPAPVAAAGWTGREDIGHAIELLGEGKAADARALAAAVLARTPNDPVAADLVRQIDEDPVALLGRASFPYVARAGDTLPALAGRFLGNPTRFYALGRYNGLPFPAALRPGQALRIPGTARPAPRTAAAKPRPAAAAKSAPAAATATARADPARAARLRAAALEQLNRGAVGQAVALLRQADQAQPGNPLVARDLDRALRIQRAVAGRG